MKELKFVGEQEWGLKLPTIEEHYGVFEDKKVLVLRPILFFCAGEKPMYSRIQAHFTDFAITKLIHDKFIEI